MQDDLHRHYLDYMPETCDWFLEAPQAQEFLSSSAAVRIQGRPGTGKTVLAAFLTTYLVEQKECVLYFFCNAGDVEKREATHVHRTLLSQLLHHDETLYDAIAPFYTRSGRATADSYVDVCAALMLAISRSTDSRIFVIIDALDECEDVGNLVQVLFDARSQTSLRLNLLFTSRQMPISYPFDEDMLFESQSTSGPIHKYIDHRVLEMKTLSDGVLGLIVTRQVSRAADGLWLYARLMLDEIENLPSAALIRRHLRSVPQGLTQLYTQILRSKEATFTAVDVLFAQQLYLWLDIDDYIPSFLSVDTLSYATLSLVLRKVNFGQPVFDPVTLASKVCSPLVKVTDFRNGNSTALLHDFEIASTHHTADQYIRESQQYPAASLPLVLRPRRLRQLHRGATAIWYLTECHTSALELDQYRAEPYAYTYGAYFEMSYGMWNALWLDHLPEDIDTQEITEATSLIQNLIDFLDSASSKYSTWVETAIIINYAGSWTQLLGNATSGLSLMRRIPPSQAGISAFEVYRLARLVFFQDYVYVLRTTGPGSYRLVENYEVPAGFYERPLAVKMLEIGQRWQYLHK